MAKKSPTPAKTKRTASKTSKSSHSNSLELAVQLSDVVQIRSVVLASCTAHRSSDANVHDGEVYVTIDIGEVEFGRYAEQHQFFVRPDFLLKAVKEGSEDIEPLLVIKASFTLFYNVESLDQFSDEHLHAFAMTNGIFNAWPYWREFAQNTIARMGLPPIMVPVFRFPRTE